MFYSSMKGKRGTYNFKSNLNMKNNKDAGQKKDSPWSGGGLGNIFG